MDGIALASVITSGVVGVGTASIAIWTARQSAQLAREQRQQQRMAEGYLEVLRLVEREAQWLSACVYNLGLDQALVSDGYEKIHSVPEPSLTDQAAASAQLGAFGSTQVRELHKTWRLAADRLGMRCDDISTSMTLDYDPTENVSDDEMKQLQDDLLPKEMAARLSLAEAIALELGHRRQGSDRHY